MSVHYKFKSNLNFDTVTFDGLHISVSDLKKTIMQQKKIGKSSGFDLQITNAQTKEVYDNDETLVPKNTSVIIARIPIATGNKKNWDKPELPLPIDDDDQKKIRFDRIVKSADIANTNATEDDKVKAMINQSSQEYDPSKYVKSRSMTGPLPPTYICYRCGKQGHWIKNCPTNNLDVKRSTGIPRSFMVTVDGPEHKGALLTSSGQYAVPLIDQQAYKEVKKEKPPFVFEHEPVQEPEAEIPRELLCMFCNSLLQDAVLIPCCGDSFCDECVRQALTDSDNHECPLCHETNISPDTVIPNRYLRTAVRNFQNETGYTKVKKVYSSPQPSPDSTMGNQQLSLDCDDAQNLNDNEVKDEPKDGAKDDDEITLDLQPGTPLADEPTDNDLLNNEPVKKESKYRSSQRYPKREHYDDNSQDGSDMQKISTIETITNLRKQYLGPPPREHFSQIGGGGPHYHDRPREYDSRDRSDYHGRYDRPHRNHYHSGRGSRPISKYDRPEDHRYHSEYEKNRNDYRGYHHDSHYGHMDPHPRHHRYSPPPRPAQQQLPLLPPVSLQPHPAEMPLPIYPREIVPSASLEPRRPNFPPQPPPPGASPIDSLNAAAPEPPPPGVDPLLAPPPVIGSLGPNFPQPPFKAEEKSSKTDERSIDDRLEAFQRELEKRDRESARSSRSSSRSRSRARSHSPRSRLSSRSSKSSSSRSRFRSSRSKSRTPYSHSRSRSYSRSRSLSKPRSYTRSRTRSRSRSRGKRRPRSPERYTSSSYSRNHSNSHSPSPRHYRPRGPHRSSPYPVRRTYTIPQYSSSYSEPYPAAPSHATMPMVRPMPYHAASQAPSSSHHNMPDSMVPITMHPYMDNRQRYPYNEHYDNHNPYHEQKGYGHHQRYDKYPRNPHYESHEYQRSYHRRNEEAPHHIPGWVGDRQRDQKPRYRIPRDQPRKEIKEQPKVIEPEATEENKGPTPDLKEEKPTKHKKHHHRHSKDAKKHEKPEKIQTIIGGEPPYDAQANLINIEVLSEKDIETKTAGDVQPEKPIKEKKHKHKKHKVSGEPTSKKKKVKKAKLEGGEGEDVVSKVKVKKKKKVKAGEDGNKKAKTKHLKLKQQAGDNLVEEETKQMDKVVFPGVNLEAMVNDNLITVPLKPDEKIVDEAIEVTTEQLISDTEAIVEYADTQSDVEEKVEDSEIVERIASPIVDIDVKETVESEEDTGNAPLEDELQVEVPELSKWEREDFEEEPVARPQCQSVASAHKEEKETLSSDILQRAENAIMQKPLKTAITLTTGTKEKNAHKTEKKSLVKPDKASRSPSAEESQDSKNSALAQSPLLQVTITADREKRSVRTKSTEESSTDTDNKGKTKDDAHSTRRIKLDRSNFQSSSRTSEAKAPKRTVVVEDMFQQDVRSRNEAASTRHEKIRPPEDKNREFDRKERSDSKDSRIKIASSVQMRQKPTSEVRHHVSGRGRQEYSQNRFDSRDSRKLVQKVVYDSLNRSRSRSYESPGKDKKRSRHSKPEVKKSCPIRDETSHKSSSPISHKKQSEKQQPVVIKLEDNKDRSLLRHATPYDESKFEPDYDALSDTDRKQKVTETEDAKTAEVLDGGRKRSKRSHPQVEAPKRVAKTEKRKIENSSTSESSSSSSESESSDSDVKRKKSKGDEPKQKHKKSRHKKHRKHKHKHKRKKSRKA